LALGDHQQARLLRNGLAAGGFSNASVLLQVG